MALPRATVCGRGDLVAENLLLRQQLAALTRPTRKRPRPRIPLLVLWDGSPIQRARPVKDFLAAGAGGLHEGSGRLRAVDHCTTILRGDSAREPGVRDRTCG